MHIEVCQIILRAGISVSQMYPICGIFHAQNLRKQYISVKRAFCIRIDIFFISADLTIIEGYYIAFLIGNITVFYQKFARNVRCFFHFLGICTVRICHRLTDFRF